MKTNFKSNEKNNVQKTSLNVIAIIISLVILSVTVDAQGIWKSFLEIKNVGRNDLATVNRNVNRTTETETNFFKAYSNVVYSAQEIEKPLDLENWMTNEFYFSNNAAMIKETEETLNLEDWMTNISYFEVSTSETESENALNLETWMTNDNYFNPSTFQFDTKTERPLEMENWMLNEHYFKLVKNEEKPLALENWMLAENYWGN